MEDFRDPQNNAKEEPGLSKPPEPTNLPLAITGLSLLTFSLLIFSLTSHFLRHIFIPCPKSTSFFDFKNQLLDAQTFRAGLWNSFYPVLRVCWDINHAPDFKTCNIFKMSLALLISKSWKWGMMEWGVVYGLVSCVWLGVAGVVCLRFSGGWLRNKWLERWMGLVILVMNQLVWCFWVWNNVLVFVPLVQVVIGVGGRRMDLKNAVLSWLKGEKCWECKAGF